MALSNNALPASLRKSIENIRFSGPYPTSASKPYLVPALNSRTDVRVDARMASTLKARFVRLPQEPEDARITGVTRSLNRRLLGLNLRGSLLNSVQQAAPGLTA